MRLKIHRLTFTNAKISIASAAVLLMLGITRNNTAATPARTRLVSGPASPTNATPNSSYLTRFGLNGTGLAAKIGGNPSSTITSGSKMVVARSMCFSGFTLNRPCSCAVVSPSQWLVKACIASCVLIAISSEATKKTISSEVKLPNIPISLQYPRDSLQLYCPCLCLSCVLSTVYC